MTPIMQLRSTALRSALLPAPNYKRVRGFLASLGLHIAAVVFLTWMPLSFQARAEMLITTVDVLHNPNYHVEMLPALPRLRDARPAFQAKRGSVKQVSAKVATRPKGGPLGSNPPKIDYASPQQIFSDLPDATNNVQTIRRPDLVDPPKLKYPIRVPSLVMLPAMPSRSLAAAQQAAPQVEQSPQPLPELALNAKPTLTLPALPIQAPKGPAAKVTDQAPPKIGSTLGTGNQSSQPLPELALNAKPTLTLPALPIQAPKGPAAKVADQAPPKISGSLGSANPPLTASADVPVPVTPLKAAVVINAVSVPAESAPAIPDAEIAGSFMVGPSTGAGSLDSKPARPFETDSGTNTTNARTTNAGETSAGKSEPVINLRTGPVGRGEQSTGATRNGSLSIAGAASVSGAPAASAGGAGSGALPGISISGGVSGGGGKAVASSSLVRNPYGLTIISSGSSGGFTRNFGVFGRQETVYTVYIPMADTGGGPDWPMQYALLHPGQAGNGLVTPPIAIQKVPAKASSKQMTANSAPAYVTGTIDENGVPKNLHPVLAADARSKCAVEALSQWVFKPAQLDGNPVASKILIGVAVEVAE